MKNWLNSNKSTKKSSSTAHSAQSNHQMINNELNYTQKTQQVIQTQNMSSKNLPYQKDQQQHEVFSVHQDSIFNNFFQKSYNCDSEISLINQSFRDDQNQRVKNICLNNFQQVQSDVQKEDKSSKQYQNFHQQFNLLNSSFDQERDHQIIRQKVYFKEAKPNRPVFKDQNSFLQQQQNFNQQNNLKELHEQLIFVLQNLHHYKQDPYYKKEICPLFKQFSSGKQISQFENKSKNTQLKKNCFRDISKWVFQLLKQKFPNEFIEVQEFIKKRNQKNNKKISDITKVGTFQNTFYQSMISKSLEFCIQVKEIMKSEQCQQKLNNHRYIYQKKKWIRNRNLLIKTCVMHKTNVKNNSEEGNKQMMP